MKEKSRKNRKNTVPKRYSYNKQLMKRLKNTPTDELTKKQREIES